MSLPVHGVLRAVLAAAGAVALVSASTSLTSGLDLGGTSAHGGPGTVDEAARDVVLSCPGPELSGVAGVADVPLSGSVSAGAAPREAIPGLVLPSGTGGLSIGASGPAASGTAPTRGQTVVVPLPGSASPVEIRGTGSLGAAVAGSQQWTSDTSELRGLTTTPCIASSADAWLLGGGGSPGRQERLVLVNPGANEVVVGLSLHGHDGPIASPTGTGVTVPAHGRAVVLLDALDGSESTPAVHVQVVGGTVAAFLDDTWLDGSVPAGADTAPPDAPPSTTQVVPAAALDGPGSVRIAVPGTKEAVVQVRLIGPSGGLPLPGADAGVTRVPGGAVAELSLAQVPPGTYAVEVTSDVPVVAAAFAQRRAGTDPGDFAWSTSAPAVSGTAGTTFTSSGQAPARSLTLVATDGSVTADLVTVVGGTVTAKRVTIAQDTTSTVALPAGSTSVWVHRVEGDGELRAAVVSTLGTGATQLIASEPLLDSVLTSEVSHAFPLP